MDFSVLPLWKGKYMIFYSEKKSLSIIGKKTKKRLCLFKDGKFETNDPTLIERLKPHFKHGLRGKSKRKGKTFEEIYGKKKAKKMKRKISKTLRGVN